MGRGSVRRIGRLGIVAAIVTTGVVWEVEPAQAASFVEAPTRLYMAPGDDLSILDGIAAFVGVDVGALVFDGTTDPISQQDRKIVIDTLTGSAECDLSQPPYDIDDCSRVQLGPVSHGRLWMGAINTIEDGDGDPGTTGTSDDVYLLPSGARIENLYSDPTGSLSLAINGEPDQLNAALADLVYTPDDGYYYVGSFNPENLAITVVPGNGDDNLPEPTTDNDSANHTIEIRVLSPNQFPTHHGPAMKNADPGIELLMPENPSPTRPFVADPGENPPIDEAEFTVGDPDNDELIDTDTGDPDELPDGENQDMMLIGFLECGQPIIDAPIPAGPDHGFHFRGGTFQSDDVQIQDFFEILYDVDANPDYQFVIDTLVDALDTIDEDLKNITLATSSPTEFTTAFAGVGDIVEIEYALSQITFLHDAPNDTCTLITVVLDLGNNGLPLQYLGSPPTGIEVPFLGFDWNVLEISTGDIDTIDVSFETSDPVVVSEASAPTPATARLKITPAIHPEFTIKWDAVPGTALAGEDYAGTSNNTLTIPANAEYYPLDPVPLPSEDPIETMVFDNDSPDDLPIESFTFEIITDQNTPPPGWAVTSSVSTKTVNIVDDDGDPNTIVGVSDVSVVEGDGPTTNLVFDVTLSGPATGTEEFVATTVDGTATDADNDYEPLNAEPIVFDVGETVGQVTVVVNGDLDDENDETLALEVAPASSPVNALDTATGTILDDDETRVASIAGASVIEGDSLTTNLVFTVSLDQPAKGTESLTVSTADVSATAGSDYTALSSQAVTFGAGQTSKQVTVLVSGDADIEPDETFTATLTVGSNVAIGTGMATGTITNDDGVIAVSVNDVTVAEGNSGTTNFTFTVSLAEPPLGTESIRVSTSDGTATTADNDYVSKTQDIMFTGPGQTASFTVVVNGDTDVEPNETFTVNLSMPVGLVIVDGQGLGTITNDDAPPPDPSVISIADAFVSEGGGSNQATISMTNPTGVVCRVEVTSSDGSAAAPGDYTAVTDAPVELNGVASVAFPLTIVDDADAESGEDFTLSLALAAGSDPGCEIGDGAADVFIAASDGGANTPPFVTIDQAVGQDDDTTVSPIEFTAVFTEPVTGFDETDIDFTGSTTDATLVATVTGGPQTYTVSVAATGATVTGTVVASIPAGAASDGSAPSFASTSTDNEVTLTVPVNDQTSPTVTINQAAGQADPTSSSPILFTVVFSEPVIGFATGDVTLGGTAGATTAVVTDSGDATTFSVAVSGMTQDGTVIASIAAGRAADAATNPNEASTSSDNQVTYDFDEGDVTAPTVTIDQAEGQADPTGSSPIVFTVVFSEPVTGFATGDVTLGGTAGATTAVVSGSGANYTVTVSGMTGAGTVIASIPAGTAVDAALNPSAASTSTDNQVTYAPDTSAPLTLSVPANITRPNDPGQAGAVVTFPAVAASGGVPPVTVTCNRTSGAFFPLGTTTVSCTATDSDVGGSEQRFVESIVTGSFTITVVDTEPPTMATPPDLVRTATSTSGTAVTYTTPAATDNAGTPTVTCAPASGTVFKVGVTTVTCTATDAAGNSTSRSFTVTVNAPASGVPATGSDTFAVLLLAAVFVAVGVATRRIGRRRDALAT